MDMTYVDFIMSIVMLSIPLDKETQKKQKGNRFTLDEYNEIRARQGVKKAMSKEDAERAKAAAIAKRDANKNKTTI